MADVVLLLVVIALGCWAIFGLRASERLRDATRNELWEMNRAEPDQDKARRIREQLRDEHGV